MESKLVEESALDIMAKAMVEKISAYLSITDAEDISPGVLAIAAKLLKDQNWQAKGLTEEALNALEEKLYDEIPDFGGVDLDQMEEDMRLN